MHALGDEVPPALLPQRLAEPFHRRVQGLGGQAARALAKTMSSSLLAGMTWTWTCGTSRPAITAIARGTPKARICALPMCLATTETCAKATSSRSVNLATSSRGITRTWPSAMGSWVPIATHTSSAQTKRPGISPAMIREKTLMHRS